MLKLLDILTRIALALIRVLWIRMAMTIALGAAQGSR